MSAKPVGGSLPQLDGDVLGQDRMHGVCRQQRKVSGVKKLTGRKLRITPRANRYAGDGRDDSGFYPRPWEDTPA